MPARNHLRVIGRSVTSQVLGVAIKVVKQETPLSPAGSFAMAKRRIPSQVNTQNLGARLDCLEAVRRGCKVACGIVCGLDIGPQHHRLAGN
jgi:hypothetical protein